MAPPADPDAGDLDDLDSLLDDSDSEQAPQAKRAPKKKRQAKGQAQLAGSVQKAIWKRIRPVCKKKVTEAREKELYAKAQQDYIGKK